MKWNRILNMLFFHESWDIMVIKNDGSHSFPDNTLDILRRSTAQRLKKKFTFQADPFLLEKEDKLYIFYEAFNFRNSKGILRCRILDKNLKELDDVKLEGFDNLKCHLSFPFLFTTNGTLYMIPESSERKEVILFQAIDFPVRWKQVKVLLSDAPLTDNVLLTVNERFYLMSTSMENELVIHTAPEVTGKWEKITPLLEVCNEHNRSAGGPYTIDNKMYILTQECTPDTYGKSVFIKELNNLDISTFKESLVDNIPPSLNNSDGVHTLNFSDSYIVYDTKKNVFSPLSFLKKVAYKFIVKYRTLQLAWR
ncbi:glucosamine inositolphosphorylceramide transferase family protein [Escherichia coli]|uniref:glucosamine inositolphosphorylceramide transferase family protein n=1 Tax=Escherichia coli TaxID=562 RepID=UPI000BE511AA|nr:hypothetical protein [Escherichia coli]